MIETSIGDALRNLGLVVLVMLVVIAIIASVVDGVAGDYLEDSPDEGWWKKFLLCLQVVGGVALALLVFSVLLSFGLIELEGLTLPKLVNPK
ncbi:MAG: hypothetical protein F4W93_05275 [Dehalococcoidia bacterium]|nr:hypothetical protein [Dehalococcoidia bacterium]